MCNTADAPYAAAARPAAAAWWSYRFAAAGLALYGLIEDPTARLLLVLATAMLGLQALGLTACKLLIAPAGPGSVRDGRSTHVDIGPDDGWFAAGGCELRGTD